jgi:hypothetical protein
VSSRIGRHIRSNVVGYVALFIALGGVTYAAGLARDSVKAKQIKTGAVRSDEAKDNSLTGTDVADGSLGGIDVTDDSITGADVQESSLNLPPAASDTPQQILDKLITVDGAGSGLSADSLDTLDSSDLYTRTASDARYPVGTGNVSMITANTTSTRNPFASFAELTFVCDAGGNPSVALKNVSGSNLRVYTDTGDPAPTLNAPLNNGATTTPVAAANADNTADHVTYLVRGGLGTASFDVWVENQGAPNATNCLFNFQALGQATLTPSF